ncbi:carboxymuconolactone decarboxylase family protein [Roseibium sp. Sym1]|uniref:carboxymuconolactone decarboxylase family protein n=1 Tax=Roseibium sp. Sym1 TaxID=3016006 RepID=UPI0022B370AC|nr:carboxymuconolactone decarboxylase family protein [Roseibium sp. Sym1]
MKEQVSVLSAQEAGNGEKSSARIPLPGPDTWSDAQRAVMEAVRNGPRGEVVGPIRAAIHNADLADRWQRLGAVLRYETVFPPALSELAILVTARRWNSELEWTIHADIARKSGLSEAVVGAIRDGQMPAFDDPAQEEVYRYTCELQSTGQVSDKCYAPIVDRWGPKGVVELTAICGYYVLVAMTLNAHRIPLPPGRSPELFREGTRPATELHEFPPRGSDRVL